MLKNIACAFAMLALIFQPIEARGDVKIETLQGEAISPYINEIVQLCNRIYREYPYLYNGEHAGYESYLESYAHSKEALICLVLDDGKAVGIAAGIPMSQRDRYQETLLEHGYDLATIFYLGEFGLQPEYQGKGVEEIMYQKIENFAKKSGQFKTICLWELENPLAPLPNRTGYFPKDEFWDKLGFVRHPELNFVIYWTNIDDTQESPHKAVYWLKNNGQHKN